MSTDTSIFSNTDSSTQTNTNIADTSNTASVNSTDTFANLLGSIKNERGEQKYKDAASALEGLKNAQEYIPQLKTELSNKDAELLTLRNEVIRLKSVDEVVQKLLVKQDDQTNTQVTAGLTEEQIAELVNRTLTTRSTQAQQAANVDSVVKQLQTSFGAEAEKAFYNKAIELGMTMEQMNALAATSPKAVLSYFSLTASTHISPTTGGFNTTGFQPKQDTFVGRNKKPTLVGATTQDMMVEHNNAKQLVNELHEQGLSISDLTNPKEYFKHFGK